MMRNVVIKKSNIYDVAYLSDCFFKGKYNLVVEQVGRELLLIKNPDFEFLTILQIGSLIFLGDFAEAKSIFEQSFTKHNPSDLFICRCRFYLGIGYIRRSAYRDAASIFAANLIDFRQKSKLSAEITYYIFQGISFFRFFKGQYQQSIKFAQKAFEAALKLRITYTQILSLDLLGHSLCQIGQVRRGTFELEKAIQLAEQLGNGGILTALQISLIKYKAQFGHDMKNTIQNLHDAILSLKPQDTYSKAELYLELSRQLILRGKGKEAQAQLEIASPLIYNHQNKRQSALFNLRFADLLFLKGESMAALALIQSLRYNLDQKMDRAILCQVDGLEKKIKSDSNGSNQNLNKINPSFTFVDSRIQHRLVKKKLPSIRIGEDPLGDILDQVANSGIDAIDVIKEFNLFGLLPAALNIPRGLKGIYLGPTRNDLIILDGSDVYYTKKGITAPLKKLILLLANHDFKTKEFLVHQIWSYQYNPLVHDSTLYALIGKLRKSLDIHCSWIEWSNEGYRLSPNIQVLTTINEIKPLKEVVNTNIAKKVLKNIQSKSIEDFNIRQLRFIKQIKVGEYINVRDYMKKYHVCSMTAFRDLAALHRRGYLIRIGKGRATVYAAKAP